jgi:hypothetical protein
MRNRDLLEDARECFRQAAEGTNPNNMRLLVELGLEYLRIALGEAAMAGKGADRETRFRLH